MFKKILVIEDDHDIAHLVQLHLRDLECEVDLAHRGDTGLERSLSTSYDLIILDITLPGLDGLEICRTLRARPVYTPILMLTARTSELDRVLGLEMGADDYLTKPFGIRELLARVKALSRRAEAMRKPNPGPDQPIIKAGGLVIDTGKRKVTLLGESIDLTAKEFDLLLQFAQHPGRVFNRSQLLDQVWGYGHEGYEHTVNSHINRLRAKVEKDPAHPRYILTVWGVGYKFSEPEDWPESKNGS